MTVEALSNVRRHTDATSAAIRFTSDKQHVRLQIENQEPARERAIPFIPRSLSERTAALGGCITVDRSRNCSIVDIKIPL
jgi:signal transduction histidine kinase